MNNLTFFTTTGLVKNTNEDNLDIRVCKRDISISLCDGHWGKQAAELASHTLVRHFPQNRKAAVRLLRRLESTLFRKFTGITNPPETSVLACQLNPVTCKLKIVSYGDCRLLVVRNRHIIYLLPSVPTWLGPLSFLRVRNRLPLNKALIFKSIQLKPLDRILLFTDGVDECVYEVPTIPFRWLSTHTCPQILARILSHGAQDNASLIILKC